VKMTHPFRLHNKLRQLNKLHHPSACPPRISASGRDARGIATRCTVSSKTWCLGTRRFGFKLMGNSTKRTTASGSASPPTLKQMRGTTTSSTG
jgi:hypothetical protein